MTAVLRSVWLQLHLDIVAPICLCIRLEQCDLLLIHCYLDIYGADSWFLKKKTTYSSTYGASHMLVLAPIERFDVTVQY